jgi:hypothetical protein
MQQQRRFNPTAPPLDHRLTQEAQRLRKEPKGTYPGIERDRLIRQAETAARISEWLTSPRPAGRPVIADYRVYAVGDDGRFTALEPLLCANDDEAPRPRVLCQESCATSPCGALEWTQDGLFDTQATGQSRHPRDTSESHVPKNRGVAPT